VINMAVKWRGTRYAWHEYEKNKTRLSRYCLRNSPAAFDYDILTVEHDSTKTWHLEGSWHPVYASVRPSVCIKLLENG